MIQVEKRVGPRNLGVILVSLMVLLGCLGSRLAHADNQVVKIGIYENAPKVFTAPSGKAAGIFVDIIESIAAEEGWHLRYFPGTWGQGLDRLEKGEIDLMPDVAYTAKRDKIFAYHDVPVLSSWFQVYARKGSGIKSVLDLDGKRVAVLERSVQQEAFIRMATGFILDTTLISVPDYDTLFEMVAKGKADAAITNRFYGMMHAKKFGLEDTAVIFHPSNLFFAAPENKHVALLKAIDAHLIALKRDPQSIYYQSLKRWTSEKVRFRLPAWIKIVGLATGFALFLSLLGGVVLKHQVKKRTQELNETNRALHTLQQRFENIVEFLPDATFVIDENKKVIAWNRACEVMTGVQKDTLIGQGDFAYAKPFFGERRPLLIDLLDLPVAEVEATYKYVTRHEDRIYGESFIPELKNGRGAHLWGVASPLYDHDGRRCGAIETVRDVTNQKIMEETLRTSEKKYRELVMLANSIILRWSIDGRIIFINEFGLRFFGYTESELVGQNLIGTIVAERDSKGRDLKQMLVQIYNDPPKFEHNINENMCRNGHRVWIDWRNRAVLDEKGRVKEILSIGSDITELKQAEKQIRQLNEDLRRYADELELRVKERTAELAVAKEAAESADRLKSAFLATMSHELRTPLNSIIGFTGIMLQGLTGPLNEEQQKQMTMVQSSARHLLSLINDVLDISKIESGQLMLSFTSFQLKPTIEKVVKLVLPLAEKKGLALKLDIAANVNQTTSDQRRLEQVLLNLVNNAIKFTEEGHVRISCSRENDHYLLSVADTGIGIKPEELAGLFQPFHQIDNGTTRKREGTGLGLSICKRLIEMMGGDIDVQSQWDQGSVFTIRFPRHIQTGDQT